MGLSNVADFTGPFLGFGAGLVFVAAAYLLATIDRTRANSTSKDDTQLGLKIVLFGLMLAGIQLGAQGAWELLSFVLGGFKGGSGPVREAVAPIAIGIVTVVVVAKLFLPRTNAATARQAERYFLGMLGLEFGLGMIYALDGVVSDVALKVEWAQTSSMLAGAVVAGVVAMYGITRFGACSGWTMPAPPPPPQPQYPPQQGGGYPPQGGYGGPQGGYGGPQGGYNPQGGYGGPQGGYNPQGSGYGPQGGGGGYPPR